MKVALGINLQPGAFGGGNQFGRNLSAFLRENGIDVVYDLKDEDIDIILLTEPRIWLASCAFGPVEILKYLKSHPYAILVHRINECDERKGTRTVNHQLALANSIMDYTIYIGSWLVELFRNNGFVFTRDYTVILNGGNRDIFKFKEHRLDSEKIKIITHHWGASWLKGWDVYLLLDSLLDKPKYRDEIEFHYVGNVPENVSVKNIIIHESCSGNELAQKIQACQIYLTASLNEPAGMHHIEGALCGLPLLYRNSGALPEYCQGYGVSFEGVHDFESKLVEMLENYDVYSDKMSAYDKTDEKMSREYFEVFDNLIKRKKEIFNRRSKKLYNPLFFFIFTLKYLFWRVVNLLRVR